MQVSGRLKVHGLSAHDEPMRNEMAQFFADTLGRLEDWWRHRPK